VATTIEDFAPTDAVMELTKERIAQMTGGEFKRTFAHSAISRLRHKTLRRNADLSDKH
jgi:epoxyqueuosine reductase QueG